MKKTGRNDPCPCGSGKKYKQCCQGRAEAQATKSHSDTAAIQKDFQRALEHHQAGRLPEAEAIYQKILKVEPNHADALHCLGVIALQVGVNEHAVELINHAISINPSVPMYYSNLGNALGNQGNLDEAIVSYRKALALKPDYADAYNNLGNALGNQGNLDEAITCYRKAIAHKSDFAEAHNNLGNAFKKQDKLNQAIACYRMALMLKPDFAEVHNNIGVVLKEQGELDQAIACYRKALVLKPDYAETHNNLGVVFREQGQLDEAVDCYRKALALKPDYVEVHNNLGLTLKDQNKLNEAIACYRKALELKPDFAEAHNSLGFALKEQGQLDEAVVSHQHALQYGESLAIKAGFAQCLSNVNVVHEIAGVQPLIIRAITEGWGRPGDLAPAAISLIKLRHPIRECIDRANNAWPIRLKKQELFGDYEFSAVSGDPLLQCLLENVSSSDVELERFLTMVRNVLLDSAITEIPSTEVTDTVSDMLDERGLTFYCALARQCFFNEYIFAYTGEELEKVHSLRERLITALSVNAPIPVLWLVAVGAYFPLGTLPSIGALLDQTWPDAVSALLVQQVHEPAQEQLYRAEIPSLTSIEEEVSRMVKQQYEENPYPRWVKSPPVTKMISIDAHLHQLFPFASFKPIGKVKDVEILIAGCGTGQQPIDTAKLFLGAQILAVDLSLTSLCYAKRKTHELGLENIQYAQADILKLESLGRTFDVIESVGVLHHLADPMAGWRVLHSLLRPGGLMRLGFYSEIARQAVVAARHFIAEHGYVKNAEDIRRCRQDLMSIGSDKQYNQLLLSRDFYGMSECRDLLFHVQEHRYTLPQIKASLEALEFDFMGFLPTDPAIFQHYKKRFPDDPSMTNLDYWHEFEIENPNMFAGMYQFWVQKRR